MEDGSTLKAVLKQIRQVLARILQEQLQKGNSQALGRKNSRTTEKQNK
jgi:hypothetical protein